MQSHNLHKVGEWKQCLTALPVGRIERKISQMRQKNKQNSNIYMIYAKYPAQIAFSQAVSPLHWLFWKSSE